MKKLTYLLCVALVFGHAITELATLLGRRFEVLQTMYVHPFWWSREKIAILWYIKFSTEELLWNIVMFVLCKVAFQYSVRLFRVCLVFFAYHFIDMLMFFGDFKRSYNIYIALMGATMIAAALIAFPEKNKKEGNVRAME